MGIKTVSLTIQELGALYEDVVGYNIHEESPELTSEEIIEMMKGYDESSGTNDFKNKGIY